MRIVKKLEYDGPVSSMDTSMPVTKVLSYPGIKESVCVFCRSKPLCTTGLISKYIELALSVFIFHQ